MDNHYVSVRSCNCEPGEIMILLEREIEQNKPLRNDGEKIMMISLSFGEIFFVNGGGSKKIVDYFNFLTSK